MALTLLFINPPIYDFTAYDFWLKPYGLLKIAGSLMQHKIHYFNFLGENYKKNTKEDGRGKFIKLEIVKPSVFSDIPNPFFRYGAPKEEFENFLKNANAPDIVFITSSMTYWYLGVKEVIETVRKIYPKTKIVLGGIYATLTPEHAGKLEVDIVVKGKDLSSVEKLLGFELEDPAANWSLEKNSRYGVITISTGCPFSCSYCAIKRFDNGFSFRKNETIEKEISSLQKAGIQNIAFYDDALLYKFEEGLGKFLDAVSDKNFYFHTPNGIHVRFISKDIAIALKKANFKTLFLSLESSDERFLRATGNKLQKDDFLSAIENLSLAGFKKEQLNAYILFGHPEISEETILETINFVKTIGIKPFLSEFSPVPGTIDAEKCSKYTDISEPLNHNKLAFSIRSLSLKKYQKLKSLAKSLKKELSHRR